MNIFFRQGQNRSQPSTSSQSSASDVVPVPENDETSTQPANPALGVEFFPHDAQASLIDMFNGSNVTHDHDTLTPLEHLLDEALGDNYAHLDNVSQLQHNTFLPCQDNFPQTDTTWLHESVPSTSCQMHYQ